MRVLVTGGAGFIGSHLVARLLETGADIRVLDSFDPQVHGEVPAVSSDVEVVRGDIRDPEVVERCLASVDRVVHLAAAVGVGQSMYEIVHYTAVNALGMAVLLERATAVRDQLEKVVVASSMSIYGEGLYRCPSEDVEVTPGPRPPGQLTQRIWDPLCPKCGRPLEPMPTPETKRLDPASIYAIGKRDHEEMGLVWGRAYGVPTTALRFFNVFGRGQALSNPYTGVLAIFASRLLNGRPPIVFEDGRQTRDFVHVSDIVAGICSALDPERGDGAAFNLGTGTPRSVLEIAQALASVLDQPLEPEIQNMFRAGDVRHCFADISEARRWLGYQPLVAFGDGLHDLVGWLADQVPEDRIDQATEALASRGLTL